jgi:hypothetical protein
VDTVRDLCHKYYGDDYKLVGNTVSYYDIKLGDHHRQH